MFGCRENLTTNSTPENEPRKPRKSTPLLKKSMLWTKKKSSELSFNSNRKGCEEKNPESENSDETEFSMKQGKKNRNIYEKNQAGLAFNPRNNKPRNPESNLYGSLEN